MTVPVRLQPLLAEFDWACERLVNRMAGPHVDSGTGTPVPVPPMSDAEYLWDSATGDQSYPPPFTTIAWRLSHLSEMLALRADYTGGTRSMTRDSYVTGGTAAQGIADFRHAVGGWRQTLLSCDDAALDTVGLSTYPYGSDPRSGSSTSSGGSTRKCCTTAPRSPCSATSTATRPRKVPSTQYFSEDFSYDAFSSTLASVRTVGREPRANKHG